jgi:hypothetical protein
LEVILVVLLFTFEENDEDTLFLDVWEAIDGAEEDPGCVDMDIESEDSEDC